MDSSPSTTQGTAALPHRHNGGDVDDMDAAYNPVDGRGVGRPAYLAPCIIFPEVHGSFPDLQTLCSYLRSAHAQSWGHSACIAAGNASSPFVSRDGW